MDVLDSGGASLHDARLRSRAIQSAGVPVQLIACGSRPESNESAGQPVTWADGEKHAGTLAERWLRTHPGTGTIVASGVPGGGSLARELARSGPVTWWPTALAPPVSRWFGRPSPGVPRLEALGEGNDSAAALAGAIFEPPPAGRARAPLWDGDYLLAPLPLTRRGGEALLRAFAPLSASWSGLDLIVLSAADPAGARLARKLGIGARVHFAGLATARAERAWLASAAAVALETGGSVSAGLVLRALSCGVPLLPVEEGPVALAIREWLTREGIGEGPAHQRFSAESLAFALERGDDVKRMLEHGRQIVTRHAAEQIGARWRSGAEPRRHAA